MSKNIIITGSGGILGSTLLKRFTRFSNYQIYAITSQVERLTEEYKANKNIHVYSSVSEVPDELNYIAINCAFPRVNKGKELSSSFEFTENLIDKLAEKSTRYFINISSQSVYAQSGDDIQTETSEVEPTNLYGMTKYAIERLVKLKADQHSIPHVNIRLGSLASEYFDQRMINRFYKMIKNKETITIDQGEPKVSYLHVEDAADALITMCKYIFEGEHIYKVYNLGNSDWLYMKELVDKCNKYGEKIGIGSSEVLITNNISEYNNLVNSSLFYKQFDWTPKYSMQELINFIFNHKNKTRLVIK